MPDTIRITGGSFWAHPQRGGFRTAAIAVTTITIVTAITATIGPRLANAAEAVPDGPSASLAYAYLGAFWQLDRHEIAALALTLGILCFAVVTAVLLVRTRQRLVQTEASGRDEIIAARTESDRVYALLRSEPQILVAWAAAGDEPEIIGDPSLVSNSELPQQVLAFGSWLDPEQAQAMELAVDALRARGEAFAKTLTTLAGRPVEAKGHIVGGRAIMRLKEVGGVKRELAELQARFQKLTDDAEAFRTLVEALPAPIWARDEAGKLNFVNAAYARAVEAKDAADAVRARHRAVRPRRARRALPRARGGEALFRPAAGHCRGQPPQLRRARLSQPRAAAPASPSTRPRPRPCAPSWRAWPTPTGARSISLPTGVAIFAADQRLVFHNAAYRSLWDLDAGFLDQEPTDSALLDQLRADRKLPEQQNFRQWQREPARGLSRGGSQGAYLASAGRSHRAGGDDAQPRRRRDLSVP